MATIITIETPSLGDRSYLAHDGTVALVIDPQRDIDRVLAVAEREEVTITDVFETEIGVFTGGSLLFGATGRPDLLGAEHTDDLVRHQYASAHRLAQELPETAQVLPTHGFGSFCSAGSTSETTASTIGQERQANPALTQDEERWVAETLAGLDVYPAYYVHMSPANAAGPEAPDLSRPELADKEALARRLADGEWAVDLRSRRAFAAGHVTGTLNFGLDDQFATYLGWLIPWGTPLTLLGESPEQVAEAQRELVRIGIDRLAGAATGEPEDWTDASLGTFDRATFADLAQVRHHRRVAVLDVRRASEHEASHIDGAANIPLHDLLTRRGDVPVGEVWVHCASGYRASIATSVLAADGHHVVLIDDDFDENATAAGLPVSASA
jgi:rhodanese-related sulfurtransferase